MKKNIKIQFSRKDFEETFDGERNRMEDDEEEHFYLLLELEDFKGTSLLTTCTDYSLIVRPCFFLSCGCLFVWRTDTHSWHRDWRHHILSCG